MKNMEVLNTDQTLPTPTVGSIDRHVEQYQCPKVNWEVNSSAGLPVLDQHHQNLGNVNKRHHHTFETDPYSFHLYKVETPPSLSPIHLALVFPHQPFLTKSKTLSLASTTFSSAL